MSDDIVRVTIKDMRDVCFCSRGSREFAKEHNLDFGEFISIGIPAVQLIALNDAMAMLAVKKAYERLNIPFDLKE